MTLSVSSVVVMLTAAMAASAADQDPPLDYSADCTSSGCHSGYLERSNVHSPVESGDCQSCHEQAAGDGHRFALTNPEPDLCLDCHDDATEDRAFLHGPVASGECTICHDPHGSDYRMNLTDDAPDLCTQCHDDIADLMADSPVKHGALAQERSCLGCHDPHAGDHEQLLLEPGMDLCLSCHNRRIETDRGELIDMAKLLKENPDHHGPIQEKDCTVCHVDIHGGNRFRLLNGEYPSSFYAPFDEDRYELCFGCHDSEMVEEMRTDTATEFRNGDRNLHYLHVNRQTKGRTCRACHDVHASKKPNHIAETVPFGTWDLPVNFSKSDTGGSCQPGCHKQYRYDRDDPVENLPAP